MEKINSIQQVVKVLKQLKDNTQQYNITEEDIQKIDLAIIELEKAEKKRAIQDVGEKALKWGTLIVSVVKLIKEIFLKNSS